MEIKEEHINHLKDVQLKYKKIHVANCKEENLPKNYSIGLWIGSRASGKTYKLCQLLKLQETHKMYFKGKVISQRIVLISPTVSNNPTWDALKHLDKSDIHHEYSDELLQSIIDDIAEEKKKTEEYQRIMKIWMKLAKAKDIFDMEQEEINELERNNFELPEEPRFKNSVVNTLVIDDCAGSSCFKSVGKSLFTSTCIYNRHLLLNIHVLVQAIKFVPRSIRSNASLFVLYKYANSQIIANDLYEEVSGSVTLDNFIKLYEFATKNPYDALVIDFSQPKEKRFKRNFDTILNIS